MDKVWFKLRQTHYPPPPEESILKGIDGLDAPFRLGHFIKDLKSIDFVLNNGAVESFPANMRVYPSRMIEFSWSDDHSKDFGGSLGGSAPIAAAAGITVGASVKAAFKRSVGNHEQYKALDTYIVQATPAYVNECLRKEPMNQYLRQSSQKTLFLITGLCVARQGVRELTTGRETGGGFDVNVNVPGVVGANAGLDVENKASTTIGGQHTTDFVWAVRLAKVHKGFLSSDWSVETYSDGATFSAGEEDVDVAAVIEKEGVPRQAFMVVEDEALDCAIVLGE